MSPPAKLEVDRKKDLQGIMRKDSGLINTDEEALQEMSENLERTYEQTGEGPEIQEPPEGADMPSLEEIARRVIPRSPELKRLQEMYDTYEADLPEIKAKKLMRMDGMGAGAKPGPVETTEEATERMRDSLAAAQKKAVDQAKER